MLGTHYNMLELSAVMNGDNVGAAALLDNSPCLAMKARMLDRRRGVERNMHFLVLLKWLQIISDRFLPFCLKLLSCPVHFAV